jgi:hypothetical protein
MRVAGFDYATPDEARAAVTGKACSREIRTALAEARCARSSGLGDTVDRLTRTAQHRTRSQYQADLGLLQRLRQEAIPRAREVLSGSLLDSVASPRDNPPSTTTTKGKSQ